MKYRIGIDTGGTFTDCIIADEQGRMFLAKAPSTPRDFALGVYHSLMEVAEEIGISLSELLRNTQSLFHGTTITTNAMITQKGAKFGLIATKGHGDAIHIMRGRGRVAGLSLEEIIYCSRTNKPEPIVPKELIEEVTERIDYKGAIVVPLDKTETRKAIERLLDKGVEAIGVSFLWSFINPAHELAVKEMIQGIAPGIMVSTSSELIPKIGEYERTATVAINCYLSPLLSKYVKSLTSRLKEEGLELPIQIMQSAGGVMPAEEISHRAVTTLGSGPVGGIIGSKFLGDLLGHKNIISTDVGGTSFDVGLVVDGNPMIKSLCTLRQYDYYVPMVDVESIGSGGGSIAWLDIGNRLRVGPQSAGAEPGPVCYDTGGSEPTVTDADLFLGYLSADNFLGGKLKLNKEKAEKAIEEQIAKPLGISTVEAAAGIYEIINVQMADMIRRMSIERGHDPRDFVLYTYGGAGPVHGTTLGMEMGVHSVLVPMSGIASVLSAFGILTSDIVHVYDLTDPTREPLDAKKINSIFKSLEKRALNQLKKDGVKPEDIYIQRSVEMQYRWQIHQVNVPVNGGTLSDLDLHELVNAFDEKYEALHGKGSGFKEAGRELITFRVSGIGGTRKPDIIKENFASEEVSPEALAPQRLVYWGKFGDFRATRIYYGTKLKPGNIIPGPAVIELDVTTVLVNPEQRAQIDPYHNIIISLD